MSLNIPKEPKIPASPVGQPGQIPTANPKQQLRAGPSSGAPVPPVRNVHAPASSSSVPAASAGRAAPQTHIGDFKKTFPALADRTVLSTQADRAERFETLYDELFALKEQFSEKGPITIEGKTYSDEDCKVIKDLAEKKIQKLEETHKNDFTKNYPKLQKYTEENYKISDDDVGTLLDINAQFKGMLEGDGLLESASQRFMARRIVEVTDKVIKDQFGG